MNLTDSQHQLRKYKMLNGLSIDNSGTSSDYILESKIRRALTAAYKEDANLPERLKSELNRKIEEHHAMYRLESLDGWRLELVRQAIEEQSVEDAILLMFKLKKDQRRLYVPETESSEDETEPEDFE